MLVYAAQMGADDYTNRCHLVVRLLGSPVRRGDGEQEEALEHVK